MAGGAWPSSTWVSSLRERHLRRGCPPQRFRGNVSWVKAATESAVRCDVPAETRRDRNGTSAAPLRRRRCRCRRGNAAGRTSPATRKDLLCPVGGHLARLDRRCRTNDPDRPTSPSSTEMKRGRLPDERSPIETVAGYSDSGRSCQPATECAGRAPTTHTLSCPPDDGSTRDLPDARRSAARRQRQLPFARAASSVAASISVKLAVSILSIRGPVNWPMGPPLGT